MRMFRTVTCVMLVFGTVLAPWAVAQMTAEIHDKAVAVLREALDNETEWVRVHAAEALLRNGLSKGVEEIFLPEVENSPARHRIGVWRVLAQAQKDPGKREAYVQRIRDAFLDLDGPDRVHAAETLGKLGDAKRSTQLLNAATEADKPMAAYARLILANTGAVEDAEYLAALLGSYDDNVRQSTAYALRFAPKLGEQTLLQVRDAALVEPEDSPVRLNLLIAWLAHADEAEQGRVKELLMPYAESEKKAERYQFGEAMALGGDEGDVPLLLQLLNDEDTDVRISAANALLGVERRGKNTD
jgi:solute:Na+ symporter, SSS family